MLAKKAFDDSAETFFDALKNELVHRTVDPTRGRRGVARHYKLGIGLTPWQYGCRRAGPGVEMPEVGQVREQVTDGAFEKFCQLAEVVATAHPWLPHPRPPLGPQRAHHMDALPLLTYAAQSWR
jgi:hypothetical protein